MDDHVIGNATSIISISRLRVRVWPVLATIGLGLVVVLPGGLVNGLVRERMGVERSMAMPWLAHSIDHLAMLVIALVLIAWLSKGHLSEYGLQYPKNRFSRLARTWSMTTTQFILKAPACLPHSF
jgi:uncharacterized protein